MKQEKTVPYNLRLPDKLKSKLEKQAREERRSLNNYLVHLLEASVNGKVGKREAVGA